MKNTLLRAAALLAALVLLALPMAAQARTRYPDLTGTVTDAAGVLSDSLIKDLTALPDRLDDADVNGKLYVAVVDFLDGETAQAYADALFAKANLDKDDVLLLGAAGEDAYAVAAGSRALKTLGATKLNDLCVSSGFATLFENQQYDAAFAAYAPAYAEYAAAKAGERVDVTGLFGQTAAPQAADTGASFADIYQEILSDMTAAATPQPVHTPARDADSEGLTPFGWIVLVLLVMLIFGQSDPARKARKRVGCGCSPLGYVIGALGLGSLLKRRR